MDVYRTATTRSDGRQLIYFDEAPGAGRAAYADERALPPATTSSHARWDALREEWVGIASHRQGRTFLPPTNECPLCPSRDGRHTEIPAPSYDVVAFDNRFPSFSPTATLEAPPDPPFLARPGAGKCEVVCFTSDHESTFAKLTPRRARTVIEAWVDRTAELSTMPGIEHVYPFENRGVEIGVTLAHPHGQIYAYPFVPPLVARAATAARAHRERTGECLSCATLAAEEKAGVRVVASTEHWLGYVPFAARWPYEVHLVSRRHVPDLPATNDSERADLAHVYLTVLRRFDALFDTPAPYIAAWVQAPVREARDDVHLHAQIFTIRRAEGKLKFLAGSESGMGVWVNDIAPEDAAEHLRGTTTG